MVVKAVEVEQLCNTVHISEKINSQVSVVKNEDYLHKLSLIRSELKATEKEKE